MDPNTTWDNLLMAYATKDWASVEELAEALLHWLDRGGFAPHLTTGSTMMQFTCQLDDEWNAAVARAACQVAIERARREDADVSP